jgi:folate-binding protein YgfZ
VERTTLQGQSRANPAFAIACASDSEYLAVTRGAGLRLAAERMAVRVVGSDRTSFLHGMCTNDIKSLRAGGILYALFLTEHAHVIADFHAWGLEDAVLIEIDCSLWPRARSHLEKLLVADDVEFEDSPDTAIAEIVGPKAREAAARAIAPDIGGLETWHFAKSGGLLAGNFPRFGAPAITLAGAKSKIEEAVAALSDVNEVTASALDVIRIENGLASVAIDTGEKTIALEARLEPAISFTKGCYVGQETIERATARGGLKKRLYGLRFEGGRPAAIGAAIHLDGKEVGRLTSAALSPRFGPIGLAILHNSAWSDGAAVEAVSSGGEVKAVVSDLPFK